jgi:hypothetical protein
VQFVNSLAPTSANLLLMILRLQEGVALVVSALVAPPTTDKQVGVDDCCSESFGYV